MSLLSHQTSSQDTNTYDNNLHNDSNTLQDIVKSSRNVSVSISRLKENMEKSRLLQSHCFELIRVANEGLTDIHTLMEVLHQHQLLLEKDNADLIQYDGKYALMCKGELFTGDTFEDVVSKSRNKYGDSPYYTELINRQHFPYLFQDNGNLIL